MRTTKLNQRMKAIGATLALAGSCLGAQAQSNDALRDVLIKKGVLTQDEAMAIKSEAASPDVSAAPTTALKPIESDPEFKSLLDKAIHERLDGKWYEKIKFAGYTQVRYTSLINQSGAVLNVPNDGSARNQESLRIRRIRR